MPKGIKGSGPTNRGKKSGPIARKVASKKGGPRKKGARKQEAATA